MAKRGWINGQNRVILTGQLQPLILTHRSRAVMLCGEEKLIYLCCSVTISLEWSTIYSRCLTRLALVGDNDVFAGFRAGILTKHRTHHRNLTLLSILALRHHFLTIKTHYDWNSLIIYHWRFLFLELKNEYMLINDTWMAVVDIQSVFSSVMFGFEWGHRYGLGIRRP